MSLYKLTCIYRWIGYQKSDDCQYCRFAVSVHSSSTVSDCLFVPIFASLPCCVCLLYAQMPRSLSLYPACNMLFCFAYTFSQEQNICILEWGNFGTDNDFVCLFDNEHVWMVATNKKRECLQTMLDTSCGWQSTFCKYRTVFVNYQTSPCCLSNISFYLITVRIQNFKSKYW